MTQEQRLIFDVLDELGGEPLDGSGFETDYPEPGFDDDDFCDIAADRRS